MERATTYRLHVREPSGLRPAAAADARVLARLLATEQRPHDDDARWWKRLTKRQGPCDECGVTVSPLWRRGRSELDTMCNACGTRVLRSNNAAVMKDGGDV